MSERNLVASVAQRLRNKAQEIDEIYDYTLTRYALERLLYRLSKSPYADQLILKGALLFYVWNHQLHRPTRDIDFLKFGPPDQQHLENIFKTIVEMDVPDDGLFFDKETINSSFIREESAYHGIRIKMMCKLGKIRIPLQIDIGSGDAVTPKVETKSFPILLDEFPVPTVQAYPIYAVIAEKYEAMVVLGEQNSRMKDFFDIHFIFKTEKLDPKILKEAIEHTFKRRRTPLPDELPDCLSDEFAYAKEQQWQGFLKRNELPSVPFLDVVRDLKAKIPLTWK